MKNEFTQEDIDDYISGRMKGQERAAFDAEISENKELQQEIRFFKNLGKATQNLATDDFAKALTKVDEELEQESFFEYQKGKEPSKNAKVFSISNVLAIAASIALLLLAGTFWRANSIYSNDALAEANYKDADLPARRSSTNNQVAILQKALDAYVEEDYNAAIRTLQNISNDSLGLSVAYFLGHAYYKNEAFDKAIPQFEKLLSSENQSLPSYVNVDKLRWNSLQAYLRIGQLDERFYQSLNQLAENGKSPYREKGKALRKKLSSIWRNFIF